MSDATAVNRLRDTVLARARRIVRHVASSYASYIGPVIKNNPGKPAEGVLHRYDVMQVLDSTLREQHQEMEKLAKATYQASMRLARSGLVAVYRDMGYEAPAVDLWPSGYLDAVLADVDRAFDQAKTNILGLASAAYNGVHAPASYHQTPGGVTNVPKELGRLRARAVAGAIDKALQVLNASVLASVSVLVTRAQGAIREDSFTQFAAQHPMLRLGKKWTTTSGDPCDMCLALEGTILPLNGEFSHTATVGRPAIRVYRDLQSPPRHPNCIIGSTRVSAMSSVMPSDKVHGFANSMTSSVRGSNSGLASATTMTEPIRHTGGVRATMNRDFIGNVVVLKTALGHNLTVTPNHPIATRGGWVPAAQLNVGDYVLSSSGSEWALDKNPDVDNIPPTVEEVTKTFSVRLLSVPLSPEDFHGDGAGSEVCVVGTNGSLMVNSETLCRQHRREFQLGLTGVRSGSSVGLSALNLLGERHDSTARSSMSGSGVGSSLLRSTSLLSEEISFVLIPDTDAARFQGASNNVTADAVGFCKSLLTSSAEIVLDELVEIWRLPFEGHVYNLDTVEGWYLAEGIVTHNCQCELELVILPSTGVEAVELAA